jgi:penicillin-binding protein 1A
VVLDAPLEIVNADGSVYRPDNYTKEFYGPQTLRRGIERSRNVMTVRLAKDIGMPLVSEYSRLFGIHEDLLPVLAMSLGAGETTNLKMTAAFATMANGGRRIVPTLIDRIQDRYGKTVFKHDQRVCDGCVADAWAQQAEPLIIDNREQVLDPMTAFQITSMMQGVVQRGTGTHVSRLGRPVAGKTGTSSDYKDAWFVGFTPELAVGVYVGYDTPKRMGRSATGGELAAPIFTQFVAKALEGKPATPFTMPAGMSQTWIDPATGIKAIAGEAAILEAFKPGTGPNLITSVIGVDSEAFLNIEGGGTNDVNAGRGGLF